MKSKFIFVVIALLVCIGVSFIVFDVLKLGTTIGSIVSGLTCGVIFNILYSKMKFK